MRGLGPGSATASTVPAGDSEQHLHGLALQPAREATPSGSSCSRPPSPGKVPINGS